MFVGESAALRSLVEEVRLLRGSDVPVLIVGETGTGKEAVARAIGGHGERGPAVSRDAAPREFAGGRDAAPRRPFVAVNCAAIPEALLEAELFGVERGAFTGATERRMGRIEEADGGTLFLDEIGELPLSAQAKLLRVLQEHRFRRVGAGVERPSAFRVVAATHRNLRAAVREGRFREDLFFRLAVYEVDVPPLRVRAGDVAVLARHILPSSLQIAPSALAVLERHPWPGNIRELQNVLRRAALIAGSMGGTEVAGPHLPAYLLRSVPPPVIAASHRPSRLSEHPKLPSLVPPVIVRASTRPEGSPSELRERTGGSQRPARLADLERQALQQALHRCNGDIARVVRELGVGRSTVYRKIKQYKLERRRSE
jgi:DNA-binding NtrC family response regulator